MLGLGLSIPEIAIRGRRGFSPASLFANGEQGAWYDPADLTTLYSDSAGTTPVTAVEQPVGLMLDKSRGLVLGSELVTNGDFSGGTTGWQAYNANTTISDASGTLRQEIVSGSFGASRPVNGITTVVGKWYELSYEVVELSAGATNAFIYTGTVIGNSINGVLGVARSTAGQVSALFLATATTYYITTQHSGAAGTSARFDNISVRELPGNHAFNTNATTVRPTLSARYNLLTRTEDFSQAVWVKSNVTLTSGVSDPDGGTSAFTLTSTADFGNISQTTSSSGSVDSTFFIRRRSGSGLVQILRADAQVYVTLSVTSTWTKYTSSAVAAPAVGSGIRLGTSGDSVDIWHPDLRVANESATIPYQRVTTSTDYDATPGTFPYYLRFDGSDDWLQTASIDFTATDKMSVFAGIRKLSDAAVQQLVGIGGNWTVAGAFEILSTNTAGSGFIFTGMAGTTGNNNRATTSAFAAPLSLVLANSYDLSAVPALNIKPRVNAEDVASTLAGSNITVPGSFGNYAMFIGRRGGSSVPYNGRLYSLIVRGALTDAATIASAESYVAGKTGVTL